MTENIENAETVEAQEEVTDGVVNTNHKIMTILLLGDGNLRTEVKEEVFAEATEEQTRQTLHEIITLAAESIKQESVEISEDPEMSSFTTPINNGSLYDEVIFETGIYVNDKNQVVTNTSFGKYCNPNELLKDVLSRVSETIAHVGEHLEPGHTHDENGDAIPAAESQPKPQMENIDDRVKGRF